MTIREGYQIALALQREWAETGDAETYRLAWVFAVAAWKVEHPRKTRRQT